MAKYILKSLSILALALVSNAHAQNICATRSQPLGFAKVSVVSQPKSGDLLYFDFDSATERHKRKIFSINPISGLKTTLVDLELSGSYASSLNSSSLSVHLPTKSIIVQVGGEVYNISYKNLGITKAKLIRACDNINYPIGLAVNNTNNKVYYATIGYPNLTSYRLYESLIDGTLSRIILETNKVIDLSRNGLVVDTARNSLLYVVKSVGSFSQSSYTLVRTNIDNPLVSQEIYKTTFFIDAIAYSNLDDTINFSVTPSFQELAYNKRFDAQSFLAKFNSNSLKPVSASKFFGPFYNPGFRSVVSDANIGKVYYTSAPSYYETYYGQLSQTQIRSFTLNTAEIKNIFLDSKLIVANFSIAPYSEDSIFKSLSHTNRIDKYDANGDGQVTSLDALLIINTLGRSGGTNSINLTSKTQVTSLHLDVNTDNKVTTSDALVIINEISRRNKL